MYGVLPQRNMRGHTVNLLDTTAWVFGGCDDKDTAGDLYCFDIGVLSNIPRLLSSYRISQKRCNGHTLRPLEKRLLPLEHTLAISWTRSSSCTAVVKEETTTIASTCSIPQRAAGRGPPYQGISPRAGEHIPPWFTKRKYGYLVAGMA